MAIEKTRLQSGIMMVITKSYKQFQKIAKLQNLLEMKTIITMLRDYCNKYDAVKLQYFFNLYISIISFELNYCNL